MKLFIVLALLALIAGAQAQSFRGTVEEEDINVKKIAGKVEKVAGVVHKVAGAIAGSEEEASLDPEFAKRIETAPEFTRFGTIRQYHHSEEENIHIKKIIGRVGKVAGVVAKVAGAISEEEALHKPITNLPNRPIHKSITTVPMPTTEEENFNIKKAAGKVEKVAGVVSKVAGAIANHEEEAFLVKNHPVTTMPIKPTTEEENFNIKKAAGKVAKVAGVVSKVAGAISGAEEENFNIKKAAGKVEKVAGVVSKVAGAIANHEEEALTVRRPFTGPFTPVHPFGPVSEEENFNFKKFMGRVGKVAGVISKVAGAISEEEAIHRPITTMPIKPVVAEEENFNIKKAAGKVAKVAGVVSKVAGAISGAEEENFDIKKVAGKVEKVAGVVSKVAGAIANHEEEAFAGQIHHMPLNFPRNPIVASA